MEDQHSRDTDCLNWSMTVDFSRVVSIAIEMPILRWPNGGAPSCQYAWGLVTNNMSSDDMVEMVWIFRV